MTLGFSTTHPASGKPTLFEQKILLPYKPDLQQKYPDMLPKIHSFRTGKRWVAGKAMHMVVGNRTAHRRQFNRDVPELEFCQGVQECHITILRMGDGRPAIRIEVDGRIINTLLFMANDGFDSPEQFLDWFGHPFKTAEHVGQIVHFTKFRYR